jgi:hypothetical protein
MRRLGLQKVRAESTDLRVWQRGRAEARLVGPVAQPLVMAALGNSLAAPADGIEADVAWYADFAELKADTSDRARGRHLGQDRAGGDGADHTCWAVAAWLAAQSPLSFGTLAS